MKNISKALLNLAAFVELSSEEIIDEDAAVNTLEQLAADLSQADPSEIEYLKAAVRQEIVEIGEDRTEGQQERITFFLDFFENLEQ